MLASIMVAAGTGQFESASAAEPHDLGAATVSSLALTKSASPTTVRAVGQVVTYRFFATNTGQTDSPIWSSWTSYRV